MDCVHSLDEHNVEDDAFYDELRRQIMQLTAEDDDVHAHNKTPEQRSKSLRNGPSCYYDWPGTKEDCSATPAWMLNLWRSAKGTGVFIPQVVHSTGKNRTRRRNERGRTCRRGGKMNCY